jgi:hypothetical protein
MPIPTSGYLNLFKSFFSSKICLNTFFTFIKSAMKTRVKNEAPCPSSHPLSPCHLSQGRVGGGWRLEVRGGITYNLNNMKIWCYGSQRGCVNKIDAFLWIGFSALSPPPVSLSASVAHQLASPPHSTCTLAQHRYATFCARSLALEKILRRSSRLIRILMATRPLRGDKYATF